MEPEPAAVTPSPPLSPDPQPGHEGKASPHLAPAAPPPFGPAAVVGSLAAIGALGGQSGLADPGAFGGRQVTGGARKQQPAKPVPLRPPLGMAQQQQQQQQGALLRVKQNPDEDADDASSSDSDDDGAHMVPQMGGAGGAMQLAGGGGGAMQQYGTQPRKRGGDRTEEKERKRLKRLLRNRVSAQQARERKKAYLTDLEARSRELEQKNAELEERVSTLQRENFMLRQIVKNTTMKKGSQATPS